jgi:flagellar biosynthesis GTPase FlhF
MSKTTILVALACAFGLAASAAQAQSTGKLYRYVDEKGKVHYLDRPPTEAAGRPLDQLNRQGAVLKQGEVALSPEQVAAREAEKRRAQEEQIKLREENRKNQALLDTYASEKDIDESRARAIAAANDSIKDSKTRLDEALKRQEKLKGEAEFYQKRPMPQQLKQEVQNNEREIAIQREAIEKKQQEISSLNAKYDDDKRRYLEITKSVQKGSAVAAPQPVSTGPLAASKR